MQRMTSSLRGISSQGLVVGAQAHNLQTCHRIPQAQGSRLRRLQVVEARRNVQHIGCYVWRIEGPCRNSSTASMSTATLAIAGTPEDQW